MTDSPRETPETAREPLWDRCSDSTPRDRRNLAWLLAAVVAWGVLLLGATYLVKRELIPAGPASWAVALVPIVASVLVIVTFVRFLRDADELQRTIQLHALALGFGAGFFAISGYRILERLGAPEASPAEFLTVMTLSYSIGCLIGWRRYR